MIIWFIIPIVNLIGIEGLNMEDLQTFEYKINGKRFKHNMFRIESDIFNVCGLERVNMDIDPVVLTISQTEDEAIIEDISISNGELIAQVLETNINYIHKRLIIYLYPKDNNFKQVKLFLETQGFIFTPEDSIFKGVKELAKMGV